MQKFEYHLTSLNPVQVLIVLQNNAAQLLAANSFPVSLKSKAVYFIKRQRGPVPKENISHHVILGDMAMKPIEHLAALVDEVRQFITILTLSLTLLKHVKCSNSSIVITNSKEFLYQ